MFFNSSVRLVRLWTLPPARSSGRASSTSRCPRFALSSTNVVQSRCASAPMMPPIPSVPSLSMRAPHHRRRYYTPASAFREPYAPFSGFTSRPRSNLTTASWPTTPCAMYAPRSRWATSRATQSARDVRLIVRRHRVRLLLRVGRKLHTRRRVRVDARGGRRQTRADLQTRCWRRRAGTCRDRAADPRPSAVGVHRRWCISPHQRLNVAIANGGVELLGVVLILERRGQVVDGAEAEGVQ